MAIILPQGLRFTSTDPVDTRLIIQKSDMPNVSEDRMPDQYFCVCPDDGKLYLYNKNNTATTETGKFRVLESGSSGSDKHFTYEQSAAASEWVVIHNLNTYPSVTVVDYGRNIIDCEVTYNSLNQVTLKFYKNGIEQSVSGYAYFN